MPVTQQLRRTGIVRAMDRQKFVDPLHFAGTVGVGLSSQPCDFIHDLNAVVRRSTGRFSLRMPKP